MVTILQKASGLALLSVLAVCSAAAVPQSPPPTQDPSKPSATQPTQTRQDAPIAQPDTVNPKNSKEDVDAIGNRGVGKGVTFYSLQKEIALGKQPPQEVENSSTPFNIPLLRWSATPSDT